MRRVLGPALAVALALAAVVGAVRTGPAPTALASASSWLVPQLATKTLLGVLGDSPFSGSGGAVTIAGAQTVTGAKTFSSTITSTAATVALTMADGIAVRFNAGGTLRIQGDGFGTLNIVGPTTFTGNVGGLGAGLFDGLVTGKTGLKAGTTGTTIEDSYAGSATIDFASTSDDTRDSSNITVTGAAVGDACEVGVPVAAQVAGASFTCLVTAGDTVVVRLAACKASVDPASGTFTVRTFDP